MTNRSDFLRQSGLMIPAAAVTANPAKKAEAAICNETRADDFNERVRLNQRKLAAKLKPHYDFIICGSGSVSCELEREIVPLLESRKMRLMVFSPLAGGLWAARGQVLEREPEA
jgi:hypothetical protein